MHLPPEVWGPFFWHTIHITALGYPKSPTYTDKKAAKEFYEALTVLIPCAMCREHYKEHLQAKPITPFLDTRDDLFKWTVDIHNSVNKMLGKGEYSAEKVIAFYGRLGSLGRSPVWTPDDFYAIKLKSMGIGSALGILIGAAGAFIAWKSKSG